MTVAAVSNPLINAGLKASATAPSSDRGFGETLAKFTTKSEVNQAGAKPDRQPPSNDIKSRTMQRGLTGRPVVLDKNDDASAAKQRNRASTGDASAATSQVVPNVVLAVTEIPAASSGSVGAPGIDPAKVLGPAVLNPQLAVSDVASPGMGSSPLSGVVAANSQTVAALTADGASGGQVPPVTNKNSSENGIAASTGAGTPGAAIQDGDVSLQAEPRPDEFQPTAMPWRTGEVPEAVAISAAEAVNQRPAQDEFGNQSGELFGLSVSASWSATTTPVKNQNPFDAHSVLEKTSAAVSAQDTISLQPAGGKVEIVPSPDPSVTGSPTGTEVAPAGVPSTSDAVNRDQRSATFFHGTTGSSQDATPPSNPGATLARPANPAVMAFNNGRLPTFPTGAPQLQVAGQSGVSAITSHAATSSLTASRNDKTNAEKTAADANRPVESIDAAAPMQEPAPVIPVKTEPNATAASAIAPTATNHSSPDIQLNQQATGELPKAQHVLDGAPPIASRMPPAARISTGPGADLQMHIAVRTTAFGAVEIHTLVQQNQVGLAINADRSVTHWMGSEVQNIASGLKDNHLNLASVDFNHSSGLQSGSGFQRGHAQQQGFHSPGSAATAAESRLDPDPVEISSGSLLELASSRVSIRV